MEDVVRDNVFNSPDCPEASGENPFFSSFF
jgi:hypothetical protein